MAWKKAQTKSEPMKKTYERPRDNDTKKKNYKNLQERFGFKIEKWEIKRQRSIHGH